MKIYQFNSAQQLPISLEEAWAFFSDPGNLPTLTPPWMHMRMDTEPPSEMYEGMIAISHVKPLLGIKLHWVTEITHIKEMEYFIDEQRFGPFRFWHHEHHFKEIEGGVEMTDIVHYALPFGVLGQVFHKCSVEKKLKEVFDYRYKALAKLFVSE